MFKHSIKLLSLSYLFFICMNINAEYLNLTSEDVLKTPLPLPYNGVVYKEVEVDLFINDAIKDSKQPIIIFGGNWCPDCRILSGTIKMPSIESFINKHYKILYIDVGRYDINMGLMDYFGIAKEKGVPRVLVFDLNKNIINSSTTKEWTTARDRKQQEIFNYFQDLVIKT
jgi:thiol-disulfide isomerase/thioredoxin